MDRDKDVGPTPMPRGRKAVLPDEGLPGLHQNKAAATERDFPHIVEIELPLDGFDVGLSREMATFHHLRNIRSRFGRRRSRADQFYCRWCFSDPAVADAFRERFGGERLTNKP
jgi:hypothetical protein